MRKAATSLIPLVSVVVVFVLGACGSAEGPPVTSELDCGIAPENQGAFIDVPPGQFRKGDRPVYPEEQPTIVLHVKGFRMQTHEVTNTQFARFVEDTGYVTDAEQSARAGGPGAGAAVFDGSADLRTIAERWALVPGADWRHPKGPGSDIVGHENHPVVQVSHRDAAAFAQWAGGRLPTEIEWEYAASLGLPDPSDPNSGAYDGSGEAVANTWQGVFPLANTIADGYAGSAPVGCFPPSEIGLYDMIGNTWEWTDTVYAEGQHTIKGGSYLCADNFCRRFRPAARQPQDTDFSTNHIGFRIVKPALSEPSERQN